MWFSSAGSWVGLVVAVVVLGLGAPSASGLSSADAACVKRMNAALAKVAKAQSKENSRCVKFAGKGTEAAPQACLTLDAKQRVARAEARTFVVEGKACAAAPEFGTADAAAVNAAAKTAALGAVEALFGGDLDAVLETASGNPATSGAQQAGFRNLDRVINTGINEYRACVRKGLAKGTIVVAGDLVGCLDLLKDPASRTGRRFVSYVDEVQSWDAGIDTLTAFPGTCAGEDPAAPCWNALPYCELCKAARDATLFSGDCELYDDGVANDSCGGGTPPVGVCGNGIVETGEACDGGDFCSPGCTLEVDTSSACCLLPGGGVGPDSCVGDFPFGSACFSVGGAKFIGATCVTTPDPCPSPGTCPGTCDMGETYPETSFCCSGAVSCFDDTASNFAELSSLAFFCAIDTGGSGSLINGTCGGAGLCIPAE